ncbi:MAG: hypothetical protein COV74_07370 [Candidatus Omnitrophica bacterium CG11_big_fil_rev_8_21_14_0_20_45_26]|uniref:DUF1015 domain-containing protein n=1 Tax=Candidatus Abzuiibacterium crystallinum TaxID=1974748 RepID=A0A2H0LN83_9BACT|nr:MAG: hypothetical protein COV74_07370 [Candidatus Omnitrophica bacterium CG11_big_fil_rev_8_21_14_0_20_45_26]PIW65518.1 MAG: hypothetical protein COW12_01625 [Candidatus Omnitrophica bacterium CG12_big_fil_rev_8_21_14_0_65_45_16]
MAEVIPFKAWRYNTKQVEIEKVVAPPYDVISVEEQEALYQRHDCNIIRVELSKENGTVNKYEAAAHQWSRWIQERMIQQDQTAGYYLYETVFRDLDGEKEHRRLVLFGLIKLEPFETKVVLPHEKTHAGPKADRLELLRATHTNFSPIFGLYDDETQTVQKIYQTLQSKTPLYRMALPDGEIHQIWHVTNEADLQSVADMFDSKTILIADGHHRYETALYYSRHEGKTGSTAAYALVGFAEYHDPGLLIYPIHRLIKHLSHYDHASLQKYIETFFTVEKADEKTLQNISKGCLQGSFGWFDKTGAYLLKMKNLAAAKAHMPAGKPAVWYDLSVSQLSFLIWPHAGIHEKNIEKHVEYKRSLQDTLAAVKEGAVNASFVMPPISITDMKAICMAGELMPQKSTYFYPKLGSGFLMHQHE